MGWETGAFLMAIPATEGVSAKKTGLEVAKLRGLKDVYRCW